MPARTSCHRGTVHPDGQSPVAEVVNRCAGRDAEAVEGRRDEHLTGVRVAHHHHPQAVAGTGGDGRGVRVLLDELGDEQRAATGRDPLGGERPQ